MDLSEFAVWLLTPTKNRLPDWEDTVPHHDLARFSLSALELTVHATIHPAELLQQAFHILSSIEIHNG